MADVANLGVHLEETGTAQVIAALGRVEAAAKGTHQSTLALGAAMGVASSAATAAFGAIQQVASAALSSVQGATIGMNASLEQAAIGFTTLLKSGEAAQGFLKDLQQFAQSTPFEFKDLIPQAQRLMAMGFAAQQVIPILTDVGNVAAAMGSGKEGIDRITLAIGQMSAATVVHAQDINQLIQAGVPAWELLAQATGKSTAEVRQLSEAGKISADVFITAFRAWSQNNVGTMMEAQSRTFIGAVSNIKDALGIAVAAGFKPLFDTVRDLAVTFADFVQSETFGIWATDLKITLGQLIPTFGALSDWLMSQLPGAMSAAEAGAHAFVAAVEDLGPKLGALAETVGPALAEAWGRLSTAGSAVGAAFATIGPPLASVYGAFSDLLGLVNGGLGDALGGLKGQLAGLGDTLSAIGTGLGTALGGSETGALDALGAAAGMLADAFDKLGTFWGATFQTMQIVAVDAANVVIPKLEELRTWLEANLAPSLTTLQSMWLDFWGNAGPLLAAFWGAAQPVLSALGALLGSAIVLELQALKAAWDNVWGGIRATWEAIAPVLSAIGDVLGGAAHDAAIALRIALRDAQPAVAQAATETGEVIRNNIVQGAAPVVKELEQTLEPTTTSIQKVGTSATAAAPAVASLGAAGTMAAAGLGLTAEQAKKLADAGNALAERNLAEQIDAVKEAALGGAVAIRDHQDALDREKTAALGGSLAMQQHAAAVEQDRRAELLASGAAAARIDNLVGEAAATREYTAILARLNDGQKSYFEAVKQVLGIEEALRQARVAAANAPGPGYSEFAHAMSGVDAGQMANSGALQASNIGLGIERAVFQGVNAAVAAGQVPARQLGASLTDGIILGITDHEMAVGGAMSDVIQRAIDRVKADYGIQSPSKVAAQQIGLPMAQGIAAGLTSEEADAAIGAATRALASRGLDAARQAVKDAVPGGIGALMAQNALAIAGGGYGGGEGSVPTFSSSSLGERYQQRFGGNLFEAEQRAREAGDWQEVQYENGRAVQGWGHYQPRLGGAGGEFSTDQGVDVLGGLLGGFLKEIGPDGPVMGGLDAVATQGQQTFATIGQAASSAGQQASEAVSLMVNSAEAGISEVLKAQAAALRAGETLVAGMNLGKGLTYGQIYGQTATQGTGGIGNASTVGPGNYYGVPVVSPLTPGTLRGYADGGMVLEPHYLVNARSGQTSGIMAENGPERIGGGSTVVIQVPVTITGSDALRDPRLYEQLLDRGLTQAMRKRGLL